VTSTTTHVTLTALCFLIATGCGKIKKVAATNPCNGAKYEVWLSAANHSNTDTIALANIYIDDSLYLNEYQKRRETSAFEAQRVFKLCKGRHFIKTQFGNFRKDTTITIIDNISLCISMDYWPAYPEFSGLAIAQIIRDGDPNHSAQD
jgi:hypothetical protein